MSFDLGEHMRLFVTLIIIVAVGVGFIGGGLLALEHLAGEAEIEPVEGEAVEVDSLSEEPDGFEIALTTGYAADFDHEEFDERYVDAELGTDWSGENWSVAVTADLADGVNERAAYTAFAHDNETIVLQWQDGEWLGYYNVPDSADSASVRVPADNNTESVVLTWDDEANELAIETSDHSDSAIADADAEQRGHAMDWAGMIDEVRVVNATMTAEDTDQYLAEPVAPLPDTEAEHTARFMFHEGSGSETAPYYHDETAQLVGVGWTSGLDGPGLVEGTDYELSDDPFTVTALSGGFLAGAPAAFVEWGSPVGGAVATVVDMFGIFLLLIPLVLLAARLTDII